MTKSLSKTSILDQPVRQNVLIDELEAYYTKAIDMESEGIVIYHDKKKHIFHDGGECISEALFWVPTKEQERFRVEADRIADSYFCTIHDDKLICKENSENDELISLIQAYTAIQYAVRQDWRTK